MAIYIKYLSNQFNNNECNNKYGRIYDEYEIIKKIEDLHFVPNTISFSDTECYMISKYKYINNTKNLNDSNLNYRNALYIFIKSALYLFKTIQKRYMSQ